VPKSELIIRCKVLWSPEIEKKKTTSIENIEEKKEITPIEREFGVIARKLPHPEDEEEKREKS